jgi:tetratricopeptide (TPR) repeat protein
MPLLTVIFASAILAQIAPDLCDSIRSSSLYHEGLDALRQNKLEVAIDRLSEALKACPAEHAPLLDLSQAYLARRDFADSINAAHRYVEADPGSVRGRLVLANAYLMSLELAEARSECDEALKLEPGNDTALKIKGNAAYLAGSFNEAKTTFIKLLDRYPKDAEAAYMLGRIYYQEGFIPEAAGQFERVLRIDPKAYKAWDNLGLCDQALGNKEKAIQHFLTAIKLVEHDHPEYDWAYANLADLLLSDGDAEQAFRAASKAADRNPTSARNFYIGGKALDKLGKTETAINWLQRSASLDPEYGEPLYQLSMIYHRLGQEDRSAEMRDRFRAVKAKQPANNNKR